MKSLWSPEIHLRLIQAEQADINEVIERTLAIVVNQALFQNVRVNKLLSPSLPKVLMDISQIQQVFGLKSTRYTIYTTQGSQCY